MKLRYCWKLKRSGFLEIALLDTFRAQINAFRAVLDQDPHFLQVRKELSFVAADDLAAGTALFLFHTFTDDVLAGLGTFAADSAYS